MQYQSTRPTRGETLIARALIGEPVISIHSPRTGRDERGPIAMLPPHIISIHSPRTGRDSSASRKRSCLLFQSTRPARGETNPNCGFVLMDKLISIHSPRTGRDASRPPPRRPHSPFQSTRPARGETGSGGDPGRAVRHFNPLAPHGARPSRFTAFLRNKNYFNPLAPHGARPLAKQLAEMQRRFQSTRPARGETSSPGTARTSTCDFNPLAPHGARLDLDEINHAVMFISIHSPRTGRDSNHAHKSSRDSGIIAHAAIHALPFYHISGSLHT